MTTPSTYRTYSCGDYAITIELGDTIDYTVNQKVIALFHYLKEQQLIGVKDIIPAYNTVTVIYDMPLLKKKNPQASVYEKMQQLLQTAVEQLTTETGVQPRQITIPVCYDLSLAPDLASLAKKNQLNIDEVIQLHTAKIYRVYMIGFQPGFAYMGSVDEKIRAPRKDKPRTAVPAGSVGIAGEQTGIYPFNSPGGWQLIGQTPLQMFDVTKEMPCYLQPGDEVQFHAINLAEFTKLKTA
jgi:inhibitor of KinA